MGDRARSMVLVTAFVALGCAAPDLSAFLNARGAPPPRALRAWRDALTGFPPLRGGLMNVLEHSQQLRYSIRIMINILATTRDQ